ncbi:MAG: hypothetical protein ABWY81_11025 [Jiangellaceae bacterium]
MSVHVTLSGPLFDGRDEATLDAMCSAIADEVAAEGRDIVRLNSDTSFKTQTPYYVTQLQVTPAGAFARNVNDGGVIYGPWLEGVGSRNAPKTRFKGYSMFRRAAQYLNAGAAKVIAERVAARFVGRM